jgi:hypothetical protein
VITFFVGRFDNRQLSRTLVNQAGDVEMTLVARLVYEKVPMMVGDLLVSAPLRFGQIKRLPFVPLDHYRAPDPNSVPHGLCQKVARMCANRMVVGWSGPLSIAEDVLGDMHSNSLRQIPTIDQLMQYLRGLTPSVWREFSMLGFLVHESFTDVSTFESPSYITQESSWLGKIDVIGSGSLHVADYLPDKQWSRYVALAPDDPYICAAQIGFHIAAILSDAEIRTAATINNWYGGGYEIYAWNAKMRGFCRATNYMYTIWHVKGATFDTLTVADAPLCSCYIEYNAEDNLVLRTFCNDKDGNLLYDQVMGVPPVWRKPSLQVEFPKLNRTMIAVVCVLITVGEVDNYHTHSFAFSDVEENEHLDDVEYCREAFRIVREDIEKRCRNFQPDNFEHSGLLGDFHVRQFGTDEG